MKVTVDLPMVVQPSMKSIDGATLFRICSWADEGEIERAGEKAARLLQEGVYDYQLVALWLAYRFERDGILDLVEILSAATKQLFLDLDGAAPADQAADARSLDRALSWCISNVSQRVHFRSKVRDDTWARWLEATTAESLETTVTWIGRAIEELEERLECITSPTSPGELQKLERRLKSALGGIVEEKSQRRTVPSSDDVESPRTGADAPRANPDVDAVAGASGSTSSLASAGGSRLDMSASNDADTDGVGSDGAGNYGAGSYGAVGRHRPAEGTPGSAAGWAQVRLGSERMGVLRRKLEGFEMLAQRGALREAAIVARDVERELGQFDPLLYLPELFEGYLSTLLRHGADLEEHMVEGHGLEERALERLYQADPVTFLRRVCEEQGE